MSVEALAIVLHHSEATGSDKVVLMGIANHDGDGGSYPGVGTLAKYARFKGWNAEPVDDSTEAKKEAQRQRDNARRAARNACRRLEALGEVETITNGGVGGRSGHERTNLYKIKIACPPNCDRSAQHRLLSAKETQKRLRAALGLHSGPVDDDDLDPRNEDSAPESGIRGPRNEDSAEPSNNHNLGNSLPESDVEHADAREIHSSNLGDDPAARMRHGREAIAEAARKRMHERAEADAAKDSRPQFGKLPPAGKPPRFDRAAEPPKPPRQPPEQIALNIQAAGLPCPRGVGTGSSSRHLIPATLTACARCGTEAADILNPRLDTP